MFPNIEIYQGEAKWYQINLKSRHESCIVSNFAKNEKKYMNNNSIYIKDGSKSYWINVLEVLYVKASGNYIDIYTKFCNYKTVRLQIGQFYSKVEDLQVHHDLVRIDRSTILNIRLVEFINPKKNTITLRNENNIVVLQVAKTAIAPLKEKLSPHTGSVPM